MTRLVALCILRPIGTTLLACALCVFGATAFMNLPVAPLPKVDMPTIMVLASLPGASPETMASSVATPLERRLGRIAGLDELTSSSSLGTTQLALQFRLDRDIEGAARDVQAAIMAAAGDLPAGMPAQPTLRKMNPSDAPILIFAVTATRHTLGEVYDITNSIIAPKMAQIPGVGQVAVAGGQQPAVRVQLDPARLAHSNLTFDDVANTLNATNAALPKGRLFDGGRSQVIYANDQLFGAQSYRFLPLNMGASGSVVLGDVANIQDDVENNRVAAWIDGRRAIMVFARRQANANIIETIAHIRAKLPEIQNSIPDDLTIEVALDRSATISAAVHDVEWTLVLTVALVVAVVWLFLGDVKATLIPAAAVPLSLIGTFGAMQLLGFSLNTLSLMALTIATGFVVDDAIVVTENIERLHRLGHSPIEAALVGAKEIAFTVLSMTVSLLAVFLPLLFMGGVVGRLFREFAWTLGLAVALSAVVSLTVTPMMCAYLLGKPHAGSKTPAPRLLDRAFARLTHAYGVGLNVALRHTGLMASGTLCAVLVTAGTFYLMPKGLFPQQDTGMLMGITEGPQDISFAAMLERQQRVAAILGADPGVDHVVSSLGGGGPGGGAQSSGTFFVGLKKGIGKKASADTVIARLRPKLASIIGINTFLQPVQDVRMGGRGTKSQYQYAIQCADIDELRLWTPKILSALNKLQVLRDVASDDQTAGRAVQVHLDRDAAARVGVTPKAVDAALYNALGQRQVSTVYAPSNAYKVVMEACPKDRMQPDALDALWVRGGTGMLSPMGHVMQRSMAQVSLSVNHEGQFAATTLSFNLAPHVALGDAVAAIADAKAKLHLPENITMDFAGTAQAYKASTSKQPLLILLAVVVVYVVLGILYESTWHPLTILSTLPSAGVGALLALALCGMEVDLIAFVGIILLVGIVKKNAIMMVDVALVYQREHHQTPQQAIYAACLLRFRPIMMTTAAALLGALPLALGQGTGSELRRPLGVAIVGGLLVSQALTLFTTPAIYVLLERAASYFRASKSATR